MNGVSLISEVMMKTGKLVSIVALFLIAGNVYGNFAAKEGLTVLVAGATGATGLLRCAFDEEARDNVLGGAYVVADAFGSLAGPLGIPVYLAVGAAGVGVGVIAEGVGVIAEGAWNTVEGAALMCSHISPPGPDGAFGDGT